MLWMLNRRVRIRRQSPRYTDKSYYSVRLYPVTHRPEDPLDLDADGYRLWHEWALVTGPYGWHKQWRCICGG